MDRGIKVALAAGVLISGASLASLFRHPAAGESALRVAPNPLRLRGHTSAVAAEPESPDGFSPPAPPLHGVGSLPIIAPLDPGAPPPPLDKQYPEDPILGAPWSPRLGAQTAVLSDAERIHVIVDGDSLATLAAQYLGSAERYLEIYEANRDHLPSPAVLPIGVELRIPRGGE
jgi:nucleoid-associated protein YgaU